MRFLTCVTLLFCLIAIGGQQAWSGHGVSIDGQLKYPANFKHFDYISTNAGQGGDLVLHSLGSFDKMNPFTLKGVAPYALELLVFDSLAVSSLDEPHSEYGLLAEDIEVAVDHLSMVITLSSKARFSDGSPVTAEDVAFTVKVLKGPDVHPFYPFYYKDITRTEVLDPRTIRFHFAQPNRELPMIATQISIFSSRSFTENSSGKGSSLLPPTGSGPYRVAKVIQGKSITYEKNPNYWAADHPVRKGMYNFDTITVKYYKDQVVALEAFKAGDFDFMSVNIAKQWARDLNGQKFQSGELIKRSYPHSNNAGMQGFLMNTRKPLFEDKKVRQAIGLAFDFEWTNASLFYGQYARSHSFFSNSPLAAMGLPKGLELDYLNAFRDQLPPEVFTTQPAAPSTEGKGGLRNNLRSAKKLLAEAGWTVQDGVLTDKVGNKFAFEITLAQSTFERVMAPYVSNLEKLGMQVSYRTIDRTIYTDRLKNFDYDMIVSSYGQSLSPGNEQRNFWHSSAADRPGSNNYAGIRSPVVDDLVDKIIYAENSEQLTAACKALDRVLWYGYYLVPNWYADEHRLTYHNIFEKPSILPLYYSPVQLLMTWWIKP